MDDGPSILQWDPTAVPPTLHAEDSIAQHEVQGSIETLHGSAVPDISDYEKIPLTSIHLSQLRHLYEENNARGAMALLLRKNTLVVDDEFMWKHNDPDLIWEDVHKLDYTMAVPNKEGFFAFLPTEMDHRFNVVFNLRRQHIEFTGETATLFFPTDGNMMEVASTGLQKIFLAMVSPDLLGDGSHLLPPPPASKASTRLHGIEPRIAIAMICWMLAKANISDFYTVQYPDVSSSDLMTLDASALYVLPSSLFLLSSRMNIAAPRRTTRRGEYSQSIRRGTHHRWIMCHSVSSLDQTLSGQ